jgi:transposase-like protein
MCYSAKLEKLQLDAARNVTGLPIFTKTDKLYSETGWATLSSRRHNRKLQLFQNIKNGHAPNYLRNLYFNFRRIPKCLDTLKIIFSMWLFHLASLDKVTPKCLWLIVIGILFPFK